jgi:hypothetical protein
MRSSTTIVGTHAAAWQPITKVQHYVECPATIQSHACCNMAVILEVAVACALFNNIACACTPRPCCHAHTCNYQYNVNMSSFACRLRLDCNANTRNYQCIVKQHLFACKLHSACSLAALSRCCECRMPIGPGTQVHLPSTHLNIAIPHS